MKSIVRDVYLAVTMGLVIPGLILGTAVYYGRKTAPDSSQETTTASEAVTVIAEETAGKQKDDIIDVLFEEQTEDILKMGGASAEESIDSTIIESVKFRLPWLMINLCTAFLASFTLSLFEDTISQVVALSATMTIIANMGGNAGNQTMAIVLRSITLGEINLKDDWMKVA